MLSIQHEQQQQQQQFPHLGQASLTSALSSSPSSASIGTTFGYALPAGHGTSPAGLTYHQHVMPPQQTAHAAQHMSWNAHHQASARQGAGMYSLPASSSTLGTSAPAGSFLGMGNAGLALPAGSFGLQYNQPSYQHQDQQQPQQQPQLSYAQQHVYQQQQQQQQQTTQFGMGTSMSTSWPPSQQTVPLQSALSIPHDFDPLAGLLTDDGAQQPGVQTNRGASDASHQAAGHASSHQLHLQLPHQQLQQQSSGSRSVGAQLPTGHGQPQPQLLQQLQAGLRASSLPGVRQSGQGVPEDASVQPNMHAAAFGQQQQAQAQQVAGANLGQQPGVSVPGSSVLTAGPGDFSRPSTLSGSDLTPPPPLSPLSRDCFICHVKMHS